MKYAITIGFKRGDGAEPEVIAGPSVPVHEQKAQFKSLASKRENNDFERIEIIDSARGRIRKAKFLTTAELKARATAREAQEKAHQEAQAAAKTGKSKPAEAKAEPAPKKAPAKKAPARKSATATKEDLNPA